MILQKAHQRKTCFILIVGAVDVGPIIFLFENQDKDKEQSLELGKKY